MYKMIVVDDEQWIRRWLQKIIVELREDITIIGSFEDGEDAWGFLQSNDVDIVITDIKMAVMTGLKLAELASDNHMNTKFIMISGYEEFEYAKKAIQLRASGYVLKPIDKQELKSVLDFAIENIDATFAHSSSAENTDSRVMGLLTKLVNEENDDVNYIVDQLDVYKNMLIGVVQIDIGASVNIEVEAILRSVFMENCKNCEHYIVKEEHLNYYYFLFSKNPQAMQKDSQFVKNKIIKSFDKVRVFQGAWFQNSERIYLEISSVRNMMKSNDRSINKDIDSNTDRNTGRMLIILRSNLVINTRTKNLAEVEKNILHLKKIYLSHNVEGETFRYLFFALMNDVLKMLESLEGRDKEYLVAQGYDFCVRINKYENVVAMLEWTLNYLKSVIDFLIIKQDLSVTNIVRKECDYMREHYNEDINLYTICEKYGINSSYYSTKFKEEVGMSFIDYLTGIRIEVAKKLLVESQETVKQISESVGYNDSKYFSRVFQNNVGCSPKVFRMKKGIL